MVDWSSLRGLPYATPHRVEVGDATSRRTRSAAPRPWNRPQSPQLSEASRGRDVASVPEGGRFPAHTRIMNVCQRK